MIVLVVTLFMGDKSIIGYNFVGIIPFICLPIVTSYIGKLEKNVEISKKVKIISWICFFATAIIGLVIILSFPEIFNTYGIE